VEFTEINGFAKKIIFGLSGEDDLTLNCQLSRMVFPLQSPALVKTLRLSAHHDFRPFADEEAAGLFAR
jgi:hypothetical protein